MSPKSATARPTCPRSFFSSPSSSWPSFSRRSTSFITRGECHERGCVGKRSKPLHLLYARAVITESAGVREVALALAGQTEFAVDVEADAMHAFRARLCFVQIGTEKDVYLLDTLAPGVNVAELAPLFADVSKTKYFHAAGGDLQYLASAGVRVKGLFDTHRAATLLGWPKVGLADLVLEKLGVKLLKEHQQSDFSIRPLPDDMKAYITDDVKYLVEIGRQVKAACVAADVLEEVELDCARMAEEAAARPDMGHESKPKLPRGGLSGAQLQLAEAIGEALHGLRLKWAEAANVPMGRMLSNMALGAIATKPPKDLKELARREGVRGPWVREHGETVLKLVEELQGKQARGELPKAADAVKKDPNIKKKAEALKAWRAEKATARKVTPSVVLSNLLVDDLAELKAPVTLEALAALPWLGEKRLKLYGPELVALLVSKS
ncbi:MAG: HRDC domain-containing protein [Myxococcaceae bacterium]|nr:HRDC domain-containing protein [Myxococcaceae bacterium]